MGALALSKETIGRVINCLMFLACSNIRFFRLGVSDDRVRRTKPRTSSVLLSF